jgi:hypothetical protein
VSGVLGARRTAVDPPLAAGRRGTRSDHGFSLLARFRRRRPSPAGGTEVTGGTGSTGSGADAGAASRRPGRHRGPASPEHPDSPPPAGRHRRPGPGS